MIQQPQLDYYDMGAGVVAFSSTRHGGCSTGNYASFNINSYCGDNDDHIRQNRKALCLLLGINSGRIFTAIMIKSDSCVLTYEEDNT